MGYRIVYEGGDLRWEQERISWSRVVIYSAICLLIFCMLTTTFWPDGAEILEEWIYPGDVTVTKTALQNMAKDISAGEKISDAVMTFCQEIINGAQISG